MQDDFYFKIAKKPQRTKVKLGITLADPEKLNFCEEVGVDFYKIFSRDIKDKALLNVIKKTKKKTFVSTGMSDLPQISQFVKSIRKHKKQFTLVHTQLDYDLDVVNLRAIPMLRDKFRMDVTYGNHAKNVNVLYVALAYEPSDLIFYVKGNKLKKHLDEPHAVILDNLEKTIRNLRELPKSIGKGIKLRMKSRIK